MIAVKLWCILIALNASIIESGFWFYIISWALLGHFKEKIIQKNESLILTTPSHCKPTLPLAGWIGMEVLHRTVLSITIFWHTEVPIWSFLNIPSTIAYQLNPPSLQWLTIHSIKSFCINILKPHVSWSINNNKTPYLKNRAKRLLDGMTVKLVRYEIPHELVEHTV